MRKFFEVEQKDKENRRKDKNEKSGPRVSNMQKKKSNFIQEKKTNKNGRDENQKQFMKYFTSSRTCINRLKRLPSAQHNS